jgi:isochorismate hydrolase
MANDRIPRLSSEHAQLLVVDIQEKLLPHIHEHEAVTANAAKMIQAANALEVPVTVSEQYVKGLGPSASSILEAAGDAPRFEKMAFSFCGDEACRARVKSVIRSQILLIGIEAHVCVQQTALDLLEMQMQPFVLADAVGSRRALDYAAALERMRSAGAVVTTVESAIFELVKEAGTERFKRILPIVR